MSMHLLPCYCVVGTMGGREDIRQTDIRQNKTFNKFSFIGETRKIYMKEGEK